MERQRSGLPGPVLAGMLGIMLVVLVICGVGARFLVVRFAPGPSSSIFSLPVGAATNQPLTAANLAHLHPIWDYARLPDGLSRMVVSNGTVYLAAVDASRPYVAAIRGGAQLWRSQAPPPATYPVALRAGGDTVFLATTNPSSSWDIYAISATTGQMRWHYQSERRLQFNNADNDLVYRDGLLYLSSDEQVIALDAATGKPRWTYRYSDDPSSAYAPFAPVLVPGGGTLYLFLTTSPYVAGAAVTALDARQGAVRWRLQETNASTLANPPPVAADDGTAYRLVGQRVSALAGSTGAALWTVPVSVPGQPRPTGMTLDAWHLVVTGSGWIKAFDRETGQLAWSNERLAGSRVLTGPLASSGVVYVATLTPFTGYGYPLFFAPPPRSPHWLYAFDAATGHIVRMLQDSDSAFETTIIRADDEHLYVGGSRSFAAADESTRGGPLLYALGV